MKKIKVLSKKFIVPAAVLFLVVILAAVSRALSISREAGKEGYQVPSGSLGRYIWLELKSVFSFSRYQ